MIDWDALIAANAPLNAFTDFDQSAQGGEGVLSGMMVGIKANIAVQNMPWTGGMEIFRDRIADKDADVVARLRAAGAAIIGVLNMEEAALGAKTDNPFFGATQNPHHTGFTPGGSSGGSGAAVAAGLCDVALGTDTMGSVRVPASYCGVYGFKPAQSSISQAGLELCEPGLDCIGPMARSLETLESTSRILIDFDAPQPIDNIGLLENLGGVDVKPVVEEGFHAAAGKFDNPTEFQLPHPLTRVRFAGFIKTTRFLSHQFAAVIQSQPEKLSAHLRHLIGIGSSRSEGDFAEDQQVLAETAQALNTAIKKLGAILLPTTPQPAFSHRDNAPANQADFTCLANVADLPAISIPAGWDNGLPFAVQLIGARGNEAGLFDMARRLDAELDAYRQPENFYQGQKQEV